MPGLTGLKALTGLSAVASKRVTITPPSPTYLLDIVTNAGSAYSLRKLRALYSGNAIRVRRSSDNAELDVGFTSGGDLDITVLMNHVGAGSGFVTTWYDQSGNTRNAVQGTAANQPRIVNAGNLDMQNGKPCVYFLGTQNFQLVTAGNNLLRNISGWSLSSVLELPNTTAGVQRLFVATNGTALGSARFQAEFNTTNRFQIVGRRLDADSAATRVSATTARYTSNAQGVITHLVNLASTLAEVYLNGTNDFSFANYLTAGNTSDTDSLGVFIGSSSALGGPINSRIQEMVLYQSALSVGNRQTVERNQGAYYGVTVA